MPTNMKQLADCNAQRHRAGAARQVARAKDALPKLLAAPADVARWRTPAVLARYVEVVQLRVKYPRATVDELAGKAGMSKGQYWSHLRRALLMADGLPAANGEMVLF